MGLLRAFFGSRNGNLVQFLVALVLLGALSFAFWSGWRQSIEGAGAGLRQKIEADEWLSR